MKKLTLALALTVLVPTYQNLYGYDDESVIETSAEYSSNEPRSRKPCRNCPEAKSEAVVDCRACCSEGRWVNSECARECGGCDMYNDQAAQEFRDYP